MRSMFTVLTLLATSIASSAQSPSVTVSISQGALRASVVAARTQPYQGGPWASIPATPLHAGTATTAADFRIRAWREAEKTRVVVFAVVRDNTKRVKSENGEREIQISTFLLAAGDSTDVLSAEQYGAAAVTVSARIR